MLSTRTNCNFFIFFSFPIPFFSLLLGHFHVIRLVTCNKIIILMKWELCVLNMNETKTNERQLI